MITVSIDTKVLSAEPSGGPPLVRLHRQIFDVVRVKKFPSRLRENRHLSDYKQLNILTFYSIFQYN